MAVTEKTHAVTDAELSSSSRTPSSHGDTSPQQTVLITAGNNNDQPSQPAQPANGIPFVWKLGAVLLVSAIRFGSSWSAGITGAMKTTIKKELKINNSQFSLLEASEDFMVLNLILWSGLVTDRIGGASAIMYGNIIFTIGSILVAAATQVRSFQFMIGGRVILAIGDIATQIAQYKVFSSWFPPNNGFASTLAFELALGKIGGFAGKSSANIIAKNTGNFAWVFWVAVFMNLFTNFATAGFYWFSKVARARFGNNVDPSTGEQLTEKNKRFEIKKALQLPWIFWTVLAFSLFQTSAAIVFTQNATELAEQRFNVDSITAGWYTSLVQYAGFFLVPCIGVFVDVLGNRLTLMTICAIGMVASMSLVAFATTPSGTAAAFAIYAVASSFGPTIIIDSIRTSMWHQSVFGSAYSLKIAMNNATNIIVRIVTGAIQDRDHNSYANVVIVYMALTVAALAVAVTLLSSSFCLSQNLRHLQWTRKQRRAEGASWNERRKSFEEGAQGEKNRRVSLICLGLLGLLMGGGWAAFLWGAVNGKTE
ncbi:major facilitator superfamily transporter [Microdochium trichocladiopsis]|uniref:Lysosomal dipeptide transporter MFSD1 n=1 Tax=Microdochium trichocladiopsis TaxID=1682393 RepID=A0A9P9BIN4_9PEZI|nr:major facilitator superfamily transporter [Microdochium trichocladiopsis]KAH7024428.1 major facilitator superfamily transporter [Microdochium trichocladiopsis]